MVTSRQELLPTGFILSLRDEELVYEQCELQHALDPEQIEGMRQAFALAKEAAFEGLIDQMDLHGVEQLVLELGQSVEHSKARSYRSVPAVFQNGNQGTAPELVPAAMAQWAEAYREGLLTPTQLYEEFEKIHPFADGNGRVGHCLWVMATYRAVGEWPSTLPPDVFNETPVAGKYTSAFGAVEA